jgi:hypothetical protein
LQILQIAKNPSEKNCARSVHMKQQMQQVQKKNSIVNKTTQERISKERVAQERTATEALSFSEAVGRLPGQYIRVMLKPAARTFSEVMRTAHWGVALLQFAMLVMVTIALHYIGHFIPTSALHSINAFSTGGWQPMAFLPSPYNAIAFILGSFLIGLGTAYFFSRTLWRGQGMFLEHMHGLLLATVPLVTISGIVLLIPATGWLVGALVAVVGVLFLYRMLIHVNIIMGVHGLNVGEAILVVLIVPMIFVGLFLLVMSLVAIFAFGEAVGNIFDGDWWWFLPTGGGSSRSHSKKDEEEPLKRRVRRPDGGYNQYQD